MSFLTRFWSKDTNNKSDRNGSKILNTVFCWKEATTTTTVWKMTEDFDCKYVHHFNTSIEQCNFVVNNSNCQDASGFLNYVTVLYCDFQDQEVLGLCLFGLWLAFLFIGLAVSADDFFCPNLHTISSTLRYQHHWKIMTTQAI